MIFLLLLFISQAIAIQTEKKPNILFIIIDDLGYNDFGFSQRKNGFENNTVQTPFMDSLVENEAVYLDNYYVNCVCSPTRATFLTGRYSIHNQIGNVIADQDPYGLPLNETSIAEVLSDNGYKTYVVGKWHLGYYEWNYTPTFRGFDYFMGYYGGAENYFTHTRDSDYCPPNGAIDIHEEIGKNCGEECSTVPDVSGNYSVDLYSDKAIEIIQNHSASSDPFYMYLSWQSVHQPLDAPQSYINEYEFIKDRNFKKMAAMCTALDDGMRKVITALNETGQLENTLVVVTSDNGGNEKAGSSNYPLRGAKFGAWEGGTRTIAFAFGYGMQNVKGTVNKNLFHGTDWYPTLIESVAGGKCTQKFPLDGVNQWDTLTKNADTKRTEVIYPHKGGPYYFGIRQGKWKLMRNVDTPDDWNEPGFGLSMNELYNMDEKFESDKLYLESGHKLKSYSLYDLENDFNETTNLTDSQPEVVEQLKARLLEIDQTIIEGAKNDPKCTNPYKAKNTTLGPVWFPWC